MVSDNREHLEISLAAPWLQLTYEVVGLSQVIVPHCDFQGLGGQLGEGDFVEELLGESQTSGREQGSDINTRGLPLETASMLTNEAAEDNIQTVIGCGTKGSQGFCMQHRSEVATLHSAVVK